MSIILVVLSSPPCGYGGYFGPCTPPASLGAALLVFAVIMIPFIIIMLVFFYILDDASGSEQKQEGFDADEMQKLSCLRFFDDELVVIAIKEGNSPCTGHEATVSYFTKLGYELRIQMNRDIIMTMKDKD